MERIIIVLYVSMGFVLNGSKFAQAQGIQFGDGFSLFVPRSINGFNSANQVNTPRPQQTRPVWFQNFGNQDSGGNRGNNQNFGRVPFGTNQIQQNSNTDKPVSGNNQNLDTNGETQQFGSNSGFSNDQNSVTESIGGNRNSPAISGVTQNSRTSQLNQNNPTETTQSPAKERQPSKIQPENACQTVEGGSGDCVSIRSCAPYVALLATVKNNPQAVSTLRKAQCGFEGRYPKVCCPETPPSQPTVPPAPPAPTARPPPADLTDPAPDSGDFVSALPDPPECGLTNATSGRIVGGEEAKLGSFPWMALLGYRSEQDSQPRWLCGGALVSEKHVVTAAHCINGRENTLYLVRLGELDLNSDDDGATPLDVPIKMKIKHETYSPKAYTNDIGVLLLARNVQFTHLIRPICLPKSEKLRSLTFERYTPFIAGWGNTEYRGASSSHLRYVQLPVVSNEMCADAYRKYKAQTIDERVICAGYEQGGKDACQGDSGGPLMQTYYDQSSRKNIFYLIGVVSYGRKCAEAGYPGVYSRTTHFLPWLSSHITGRDFD